MPKPFFTVNTIYFINTAIYSINWIPKESTPKTIKSHPGVSKDDLEIILKSLGDKPAPVPGFKWVAQWSLQKDQKSTSNKSFEEIVLDKIKGPQKKETKKRKKVDRETKVITEDEYLEALREMEDEEQEKKNKAKEKKDRAKKKKEGIVNKPKTKVNEDKDEGDLDEMNDKEMFEDDLENEDLDIEEDTEESELIELIESYIEEEEERLKEFWKSISPPIAEADVVQKWYAVIYTTKRKSYLYIGKALNRFLVDENGPVESLNIDCCLIPSVGNTDVLDLLPPNQPCDVSSFPLANIIQRVSVEPLRGRKWKVHNYNKVKSFYDNVVNIDRDSLAAFV